jgi:23S rRNA pseudouridine2605 synthase
MSDDSQQPVPKIETALPLEQVEPIKANAEILDGEPEAEGIEHGMFDDASDDFAYEAGDDEMSAEEMDSDEDSAPYDYDGAVDEEFDPPANPERQNTSGRKKDKKKTLVAESGISEVREFDGDNDPSPGARVKRDEHTGPAKFAPQRLAKILAAAGIDARRKCEEFVTTGRVTVDGKVITDVAFRADPYSQKIELDGEKLKVHRKVYFVLNKPRGVVCTNFDPAGKPRVIDLFPQFKERIFAIGRLDEESEGLLLVTNDGELANRMAHPRYRVPKFYICHVKGVPSSETLAELKRGMYFEEGRFSVEGVRMKKAVGDSSYLDIVLNEGQNREIRRLLARVNHKVMRLKRIGFGPIRLGDLPVGAFRQLTTPEVALLNDLSQQRAYLDNTAGRGRKKKFGEKPRFGGKPFRTRSETDAPAESSGEVQRGPRRYGRRDEEPQRNEQAQGERRYGRRDDQQQGDSQAGPTRRYSPGSRPTYREGGYGQGGPPAQRRYSQGAGESRGEYSSRSPRRYQSDQTNEAFQPQANHSQSNDDDGDFNGGRRRFVTDNTPESSFTRRRSFPALRQARRSTRSSR